MSVEPGGKRTMRYRIVPGKHPPPSKHPSPNFGSFVIFEVLCVTAHRAKFLGSELKVTPLRSFWCASGSMRWRFSTYLSIALFAAFFPWVRNSCTASNKCFRRLATRHYSLAETLYPLSTELTAWHIWRSIWMYWFGISGKCLQRYAHKCTMQLH